MAIQLKVQENINNVLYVAAKWPGKSKSNDGGDTTINEFIESLSPFCNLDLLCFRDDIEQNIVVSGISKVFVIESDFARFQTYSDRRGEKFFNRIEQSKIAARAICKIANRYQIIIVQHASLILDLDKHEEIMKKLILLPMFTSTSYEKAGEYVPHEYKLLEQRCIRRVSKIITPSYVERDILVSNCGVDSSKIFVIPRAVDCVFHKRKLNTNEIRLVYVASVRLQKNHMCALRIVNKLRDLGYEVSMVCIGAIQDEKLFEECMLYVKEKKLLKVVSFIGNLSSVEMKKIMDNCMINISVSNWETFGRGIYEGMAMGLPTVVFNKLECVLKAENIGVYPIFVSTEDDMADSIIKLIKNNGFYESESRKGRLVQKILSFDRIQKQVKQAVIE